MSPLQGRFTSKHIHRQSHCFVAVTTTAPGCCLHQITRCQPERQVHWGAVQKQQSLPGCQQTSTTRQVFQWENFAASQSLGWTRMWPQHNAHGMCRTWGGGGAAALPLDCFAGISPAKKWRSPLQASRQMACLAQRAQLAHCQAHTLHSSREQG